MGGPDHRHKAAGRVAEAGQKADRNWWLPDRDGRILVHSGSATDFTLPTTAEARPFPGDEQSAALSVG